MTVKIETYCHSEYDEIWQEYGKVLNKFGLEKVEGTHYAEAYITINDLVDLLELEKALGEWLELAEDWSVYFGIVLTHTDSGRPLIVIKDNYD